MSKPRDILKNNLLYLDNKAFISSKILDDLSGRTIPHKKRWLEPVIKTLNQNSEFSQSDVLRVEPESGKVIVAYRIMQYLIVSTTKIPWTPTRQEYIAYHFHRSLIPTHDVFNVEENGNAAPEVRINEVTCSQENASFTTREKVQRGTQTDDEKKAPNRVQIKRRFSSTWNRRPRPLTGFQKFVTESHQACRESRLFWDAVIRYADHNKFSVHDLIQKFVEEAESRKCKGGKNARDVNHIKIVVNALFQTDDEDQREKLREELTLASKTENWSNLLLLIRKRLEVTGLGRNIIPSVRTLQRENSLLIQCFYNTMQPQHTYSGFRIDLVSAVQFVAYFRLKKRCLSGISVDIWGDGAEIGKVNVTRLAFRILNQETQISAQSVDNVFTFACFRGKVFVIISSSYATVLQHLMRVNIS